VAGFGNSGVEPSGCIAIVFCGVSTEIFNAHAGVKFVTTTL
jgi:hypothetical protein